MSLFLAVGCRISSATYDYPPFFNAVSSGNVTEADKLLRSGELINQRSFFNQTPLHVAAKAGQQDMVRWLLARDANPLAVDQNGRIPVDYAKVIGNTSIEEIINHHIELEGLENAALKRGDITALKKLLEEDVRKFSILHILAQVGDLEELKNQIQAGADVNAKSLLEWTPLHKAIVGGNPEVVEVLLKNGADVNARDVYNDTPLYSAALIGNKEIVKILIANSANMEIRSVFRNETPLELAKRTGKEEIVLLLQH